MTLSELDWMDYYEEIYIEDVIYFFNKYGIKLNYITAYKLIKIYNINRNKITYQFTIDNELHYIINNIKNKIIKEYRNQDLFNIGLILNRMNIYICKENIKNIHANITYENYYDSKKIIINRKLSCIIKPLFNSLIKNKELNENKYNKELITYLSNIKD